MKVIIKKEYDTVEVVEKLEKVLRKSKAQVIIDKDEIKDVINILKYFDGEFQEVKNKAIKEVEKLKNVTEQLKEQMKMMEESRNNQNRSVIEKTTKNCTHISHLTELPYCFGSFDAKEVNCIFCGSRSGCEKYKGEKSIQETLCDNCIWKDTESCKCDCSRERMTVADVKVICDCFGKYTTGESLERECCDCKYIEPCSNETAKKKASENE